MCVVPGFYIWSSGTSAFRFLGRVQVCRFGVSFLIVVLGCVCEVGVYFAVCLIP